MVNVSPASSFSDEITSVDSDIANDPILDSSKLSTVSLPFIKNQGQLDDTVKLYVNTFAGTVFVTSDGLTYSIIDQNEDESFNGISIRETLLNSNPLNIIGIDQSKSIVNYFIGKQENWQSNIPTYNGVSLGEVWPSIDVTLKAHGNNVEKIFRVAPGGTVHDITLSFDGIDNLSVSSGGDLLLDTELGMISMTAPVAYQYIDGMKNDVEVYYTISGNEYGFVVGEYDKNYDLIIDPLLASTFLGGSGTDNGGSTIIDSSGNVFMVGTTTSLDFPITVGSYDETHNGNQDVFVSKFNSDLTTLLTSTYLGGSENDSSFSIDLDSSDNVFVTGYTLSSDFPTTAGAYDESYNGGDDVFVSKFDNNLTTLFASTFVGGTNSERNSILTFDSFDNVFVTGFTQSTDFPTTAGAYDESYNGGDDVFVSKFDNNLTTLFASTYFGGIVNDEPGHVIVDSSDNIFIGGNTFSSDFPTTVGAFIESYTGFSNDSFISKFDNNLTTLLASTILSGGSSSDHVRDMAFDSFGNVFVTGPAGNPGFPTTSGAFSETNNGSLDFYISKLNSDLTTLIASTYVGGSNLDFSFSIDLDSSDNVFVTGYTRSSDFPTISGAYDETHNGDLDVAVSELNSDLTTLLASTFIGGTGQDFPDSLVIDSSGNIFVAGGTRSSDFPTIVGSHDTIFNGGLDTFIFKINNNLSAVTVDVNGAPVAVDDAASADEQVPTLIDVLANDSDPDGDPLIITSVTNPPNGNAAVVVDASKVVKSELSSDTATSRSPLCVSSYAPDIVGKSEERV